MTLPNSSATSGGETYATQTVSGKEYPVGMGADADGHIHGSLPAWAFVVPPAAAAASKVFFDVFNNQAATVLRLRKLFAIVATDVAVAPTVGFRLDTMRTNSVGTGGTGFAGATTPSASKGASSFWPFTPGLTLPAGVTGRVTPTGGAADEQWLWPTYVGAEESMATTGAGGGTAYLHQYLNLLPDLPFGQAVELPQGKGLKVVQGNVASAGNVGFLGAFTVE